MNQYLYVNRIGAVGGKPYRSSQKVILCKMKKKDLEAYLVS